MNPFYNSVIFTLMGGVWYVSLYNLGVKETKKGPYNSLYEALNAIAAFVSNQEEH